MQFHYGWPVSVVDAKSSVSQMVGKIIFYETGDMVTGL